MNVRFSNCLIVMFLVFIASLVQAQEVNYESLYQAYIDGFVRGLTKELKVSFDYRKGTSKSLFQFDGNERKAYRSGFARGYNTWLSVEDKIDSALAKKGIQTLEERVERFRKGLKNKEVSVGGILERMKTSESSPIDLRPEKVISLHKSMNPGYAEKEHSNDETSDREGSDNTTPKFSSQEKNTSSEIKEIQTRLKSLGYNIGKIDGIIGPKTKKAIIDSCRHSPLTAEPTDEELINHFIFWTDKGKKALPKQTYKEEKKLGERQKSNVKTVDLRDGVTLELVWVPPGVFMMGSKDTPRSIASKSGGIDSWASDEYPRHKVSITNGFWMGKYEVTQAQWQTVMGNNPSHFKEAGPKTPVEKVSWNDCQKFMQKVSQRTGQTFRLPTEAEWEYACRAGTETAFHYGDTLTSNQANFNGEHPYPHDEAAKGVDLGKTISVGSYPPNAFGLYDMHGNVFEWCQDWYGENYYQNSPVSDPSGPSYGLGRVTRGGSWREYAGNCRSAYRNGLIPNGCYFIFGLRVVMTSEEQSGKTIGHSSAYSNNQVSSENTEELETLNEAMQRWNWRYKLAFHLRLFLVDYSIVSSVIVNKADDNTIEIQLKGTRGPSKSRGYIHSLVRDEAKSWLKLNGISFGYVSVQVD